MSLTPYPIPVFGGLNLVDDPEEVGTKEAIDILNVDLDKPGLSHIRSRDGYAAFTAVAANTDIDYIAPFYTGGGLKHLIASLPDGIDNDYIAYAVDGSQFAVQATGVGGGSFADTARFGGPGAEVIYITSRSGLVPTAVVPTYKWDGATWSTAVGVRLGGAGVYPYTLEVKAGENRLVGAFSTSNASRVGFSDPGTPETWAASNFVDLTPGDGERITSLVSWREMIFAFKETKFFVFGETTASGTGTPIFNYRPISSGVGAIGKECAVSSPAGVYFLSRRGIYLTSGNDPVLISRAIDPIFQGGLKPPFSSSGLNYDAIDQCALHWHSERLYFSYPSGSSTINDRILVYDPKNGYWTLWNIPAAHLCSFRPDSEEELMFSYSTGLNHIGRHSPAYTTDAGTAITSVYQSGFYSMDPGKKITTRWTELWGTGAFTLDLLTNHEATDPLSRGGTVTLGTAPQVARAYHNKSYMGDVFSHKLTSTVPWSLNRIEHQSQFGSQPQ